MIDLHSHILPGIDDGAKTFDDSLEILRGLASQGITEVVLTPHYVVDTSYVSTRKANQKIFAELQTKIKQANIPVQVYLANEIYIDREIEKLLKAEIISPINDTKNILVELPMSGEFQDYEDILLSLKYAGWNVILAHPERYHSFQKNYNLILSLVNQGILLQSNLGSIIGQYDKEAKKTVKHLAKDKLIYCFGTDIHRVRDFSEIAKAQKKLRKYYSEEELEEVLNRNPHKIIHP